MAPAESYLDPTTSLFDRSLLHTYPEWDDIIKPPFAYHGRNCYAYILSRFSKTILGRRRTETQTETETEEDCSTVDTFDFVTVQLYEGYSRALYNISIEKKMSSTEFLDSFVKKMEEGWDVDFAADSDLQWPKSRVRVPREKLVIGLANGWAGDGKFLFVPPEEIAPAFDGLAGETPRGAAFWCIQEEGKNNVWMAAGLNSFLKIRDI
jgi:hypothetical protein